MAASHVGSGRSFRLNIFTVFVQVNTGLEEIIVEKGRIHFLVLPDADRNDQMSAFSCQILGQCILSVQIVAQVDNPGGIGCFHGALVIEFTFCCLHLVSCSIFLNGRLGTQVPGILVIAIVGDGARAFYLKGIHHINALHTAVFVQIDIHIFIFFRRCRRCQGCRGAGANH
ncbi:hypothetical protein SDC9_199869 [bioreactor metagenome]|uniref:Uncharacterized protein n=1 Tax=bioreactor metagenome TaxID=1076179 RepID=A0A645IYB3_9ZZZZ